MKNNVIYLIYNKNYIDKVEETVNLFGKNKKFNAVTFINFRLFTTIILFVIFLSFNIGVFYSILFVFVYYFLTYKVCIDIPLSKRKKTIEKDSIYFFEILALSLQSEKNLEKSIKTACDNINSSISVEFKDALFKMNFGKTLVEVLNDMKRKIPSDSVNNIITNMVQSKIYGNSILDAMYNQLDFLKEKQIMGVKTEIGKIPIKVSVISVLFFVPLMLLLILSPIILEFILS